MDSPLFTHHLRGLSAPPPIHVTASFIKHHRLYQVYYYFMLPVAVTLSFVSAATVLYRVLKSKPRGIFSEDQEENRGPHATAQFFDTLVYVLSAIQTYVFGVWCLYLPFFYIFPGIPLIGRLDSSWLYHPDPDPIRNSICIANYLMILPAIWVQIGWHTVIAYVLHAFIAQRRPLPSLHRCLKPAFLIIIVGVVIKTSLEQLGYYYPPMSMTQYYSFQVFNGCVTIFMALMYGTSLCALARGRSMAMSPNARAIRDRLLAICSYLMMVLATRAVMVALPMGGYRPPMPLKLFCNFAWLLWGFFDSVFLGKLCGKTCFGGRKPRRVAARRQTTDNRVRMGLSAVGISARSFFTSLYPQYNASSAACNTTLRQPLDPGMVELHSTQADRSTVGFDGDYRLSEEIKVEVEEDGEETEEGATSPVAATNGAKALSSSPEPSSLAKLTKALSRDRGSPLLPVLMEASEETSLGRSCSNSSGDGGRERSTSSDTVALQY